ncbi:MAG: hypothetical protein VX694_15485 [Planctomycetota bacterium]|nr:hypothetical protein [Planctomycetota bacterium]
MSTQPISSQITEIRNESMMHGPQSSAQSTESAVIAKQSTDRAERSQLGVFMILVLSFVAGIFMASRASGQAAFPYDSVAMPEGLKDEAVVRRVEGIAKSFATTGNGDQAMVNGYFKVYVPAKMTAPDGIKDLTAVTQEAANLLVRAQRSNNQAVIQRITLLLLESMKGVAEGNYHPAARINAILLLSRLDRQLANPATKTPPLPLEQTLPILLSLYQDANNVDGVRAAALHGIHRHVRFGFPGIDAESRGTITQEMTSLLNAPAPAGRNAKAHAYLQRFAVDILDLVRPAEDNSLGTQLVSISADSSRPDLIALYSAARSGAYGASMPGEVAEPKKVLNSWGQRVLHAFQSEIDRYDRMQKVKPDSDQPINPESFLESKAQETSRTSQGTGMGGEMEMGGMDMEMEMGGMGRGSGADMEMDMDMDMDMGMDMMMGGMSGGRGGTTVEYKTQPAEVLATRKKLNYILQQVQLGMTGYPTAGIPPQNAGGLLVSAAPEQKLTVEKWVTALEGVITVLNDASLDDMDKFREGIEEQIVVLQDLVGGEIAEIPVDLPDELTPANPLAEIGGGVANPVAPAANPGVAGAVNVGGANGEASTGTVSIDEN